MIIIVQKFVNKRVKAYLDFYNLLCLKNSLKDIKSNHFIRFGDDGRVGKCGMIFGEI